MITAIISRKGGVGKTTTSVNLAAAFAGIGKRVLLLDLDSQASASMSLGVDRSQLAPSTADILLNSVPINEVIRPSGVTNLDMITASADLSSADQVFGGMPTKHLRLRNALRPIRDRYDLILFDCPPSMTVVPLNALVAADNFIIPAVPHYLAIEGIANILPFAERLYERFGTRTPLLGIALTMVDYRTKANRENVRHLRSVYGSKVFAIEIRTNIRLAEAPAFGKSIFEHDNSSTGAKAYRLLAAEILMRATTGPHRQAVERSADRSVARFGPPKLRLRRA